MLLRVLPKRIEPRFVRAKAGVHRHQLDAAQLQLLMAKAQLLFPARLCRIERQKTEQPVGMSPDVISDVLIIDPQAAVPGLAAEDDGADGLGGRGAVVRKAHRQIDLRTGSGSTGLQAKVGREML